MHKLMPTTCLRNNLTRCILYKYAHFTCFKALTFWHKWRAHEGESKQNDNILFTVRQSHPLQIKKELNVFLENNVKKKVPDFHVTGSYTSLSFKVFEGRRLIAEVRTKLLHTYIFLC